MVATFLRFKLIATFLLGAFLTMPASAQQPDPNAAPNTYVQQVADQVLNALKKDQAARSGNMTRINEIVNQYILPYVNLEKTTRLAAGRAWRDATPEQQAALVKAFSNTLVRTYSGALTKVDDATSMRMMPFRDDAQANDVVVQSQVTQFSNSSPIQLDYRLEKTPKGWKIYDINVEKIWLIENYRNQFAQQISQNGINGLIDALNKRNQTP